jgi:hypothetical protein
VERERIEQILTEAIRADESPHRHWLLPHVVKSLRVMLDSWPSQEALVREAGGLGRIVTDDHAFSDGPLGSKLLDLITEILSEDNRRFRRWTTPGVGGHPPTPVLPGQDRAYPVSLPAPSRCASEPNCRADYRLSGSP